MTLDKRENTWNVLRTRSRQEKVVEKYLEQKQIEVYLPKIVPPNRSKYRQKRTELPLFPGYVFVKPTQEQVLSLNYIPGTCGLVLERNRPGIVYESELSAIRILLGSDIPVDLHPGLIPGMRVKVMVGPLAGIEGELVSLRNQQRLVINAKVLGHSVSVEIHRHQIIPL
jgi:transcription antitermination factor NusG